MRALLRRRRREICRLLVASKEALGPPPLATTSMCLRAELNDSSTKHLGL